MTGDLDRFLRAVRTLARLAKEYSDEAFVEALMSDTTANDKHEAWFVGEFLMDIAHELKKRKEEWDAKIHCKQCGRWIEEGRKARKDNRRGRSDGQYCTSACRQAAYRKRRALRITSRTRGVSRDGDGVTTRGEERKS